MMFVELHEVYCQRVRIYTKLLCLMSATTWKQKQINTPPTHSNQFQLFHYTSRQQYGYVHHSLFYRTCCIFRRIYITQQL